MSGRLEDSAEVGPIEFRSDAGNSLDEGVDHIRLPAEPRSFAPAPPAPDDIGEPVLSRPPPIRRRKGLTRGLALGIIFGAAIGGAGAFYLRRVHTPPPTPERRPASRVLIQAMDAKPGPASIPAAPGPVTEPRLRAAAEPEPPQPGKPAPRAFDLDKLAQAIAAATSPPPAASAPPVAVAVAPPEPPPPPQVETPKAAPVVVARAPPPPPPVAAAPKLDAPRPAPRFDAEMMAAQRELALAYDRAMASAPDRGALHFDQQRWETQRERVSGDRNASLQLYRERTAALLEQDRIERKKGGIARLLRN